MKAYFYPTLEKFYNHRCGIEDTSAQDVLDRAADRPLLTQKVLEECYRELSGRQPYEFQEDFRWRTHSGEELDLREMATPHLFYALRMIWNNVVPSAFRVGKFKRYADIYEWSPGYLEQAVNALLTELLTREEDFDEEISDCPGETIEEQLCDLVSNCGFIAGVLEAIGYDVPEI